MQNKKDLISKLDQIINDVDYNFSKQDKQQLQEIRDCLAAAATEEDYLTWFTELIQFILLIKELYDLIQWISASQ